MHWASFCSTIISFNSKDFERYVISPWSHGENEAQGWEMIDTRSLGLLTYSGI